MNRKEHVKKKRLIDTRLNLTTIASKVSSTIEGPYGSVMGSVCTTSPGLIDYIQDHVDK